MAGHELDPDTQFLNFLSIYDTTGGDAAAVARSGAKDQVTYTEEFQRRQTLIFFSYELRDGRWQSEGKTPEQLIDPDKPGADRLGRVLAAEKLLEGTPDGRFVIIPSEELGYGRSYLYVVSKEPDGYRQGVAIEHQGTGSEFQALVHRLSLAAVNGNEHRGKDVDVSKPLLFSTEFHPQDIVETIQSTTSDGEYLSRLERDVHNFPLLLQKHNDQILELAKKYESTILSHEDVRQAFWAVTTYMVESVGVELNEATAGIIDGHRDWYIGRDAEPEYGPRPESRQASIADTIAVPAQRVTGEAQSGIQETTAFIVETKGRDGVNDRISLIQGVGEERRIIQKGMEGDRSAEKPAERLTLEKMREKPVELVKEIEKRHAQMRRSMVTLAVIAETSAALGAAPVVLAKLVQEQPGHIRRVGKSIERHEKKEQKAIGKHYELRKEKSEGKKEGSKVQNWKREGVQFVAKRKEEKRRKKRRKVYAELTAVGRKYTFERQRKHEKKIRGNTIAAAEKLTPIERAKPKKSMQIEKREKRIRRRLRRVARRAGRVLEAKRVPKKEKTAWMALAMVATAFVSERTYREKNGGVRRSKQNVIPNEFRDPRSTTREMLKRAVHDGVVRKNERVRKPGGQENKSESVAAAGVRIGWIVWTLLALQDMYMHKRTAPIQTERIPDSGRRVSRYQPRGQDNSELRVPWILLSIMYYLTAIREQGLHNIQQLHTTPLRQGFAGQANNTNAFPKYGVIFVHVHGMMGSYG